MDKAYIKQEQDKMIPTIESFAQLHKAKGITFGHDGKFIITFTMEDMDITIEGERSQDIIRQLLEW